MSRTISPPRSIAEEVANELAPLLTGERAAFARRCHDRQISMAHLFLMSRIEQLGPLPMSRVAELIGSSLPTATGIVSRMEDRGLVRRHHDEQDRRVVKVALTAAGSRELSGLHRARRRRFTAAASAFSDEEAARLVASIRRLREALARLDEDAAP